MRNGELRNGERREKTRRNSENYERGNPREERTRIKKEQCHRKSSAPFFPRGMQETGGNPPQHGDPSMGNYRMSHVVHTPGSVAARGSWIATSAFPCAVTCLVAVPANLPACRGPSPRAQARLRGVRERGREREPVWFCRRRRRLLRRVVVAAWPSSWG